MVMTSSAQENTWAGVTAIARRAGAKFPELVAAQWALESGWGKSVSGRHNYFGLKGPGTDKRTQEYVNGKPIEIVDGFLDFPSLEACVEYLVSRWYKDFRGYKGVNQASSRSAAARMLQVQGYATNPRYAEKLIGLMNEHAPAQPESNASRSAKPLFEIEAVLPTALKKLPKQVSELKPEQMVIVLGGKRYGVLAYEERPADSHARVELAAGAGTWYVFEPHWRRLGLGGEGLPAVVNWGDFNCLVTPNLTVGEVLQWDRRRAPKAGSAVIAQLLATGREYQKIRDAWARPLGITSFYRPEPINRQVGGAPGSKHTTGEAIDVYPVDMGLESFFQWIRRRWRGGLGDGRSRGFIHLDTAGGGFVAEGGVTPSRTWIY